MEETDKKKKIVSVWNRKQSQLHCRQASAGTNKRTSSRWLKYCNNFRKIVPFHFIAFQILRHQNTQHIKLALLLVRRIKFENKTISVWKINSRKKSLVVIRELQGMWTSFLGAFLTMEKSKVEFCASPGAMCISPKNTRKLFELQFMRVWRVIKWKKWILANGICVSFHLTINSLTNRREYHATWSLIYFKCNMYALTPHV